MTECDNLVMEHALWVLKRYHSFVQQTIRAVDGKRVTGG